MKLLIIALLALLISFNPTPRFGRFAVSHDGNIHDRDDIGAVAMTEAIIWKANAQGSMVHLNHSNHIGANDPNQHHDMKVSAERGLGLYGIPRPRVFDGHEELYASVTNLALQINSSSHTNRLTIIQAGPWELMALAFDYSDPAKHRFVNILSHSSWNDEHAHQWNHRNKVSFFAQYSSSGRFAGYREPTYTRIDDQNHYAFKSDPSAWSWMDGSPQTSFVLNRTIASIGYARGDMSDAGMVFYYVTGIEHPTMQDVRNFFEM